MEKWLKDLPAEWGTSSNGLIDVLPLTNGMFAAGDCAKVFESLERFELRSHDWKRNIVGFKQLSKLLKRVRKLESERGG